MSSRSSLERSRSLADPRHVVRRTLVPCLVAVVVAVSCTGGDDDDGDTSGEGESAAGAALAVLEVIDSRIEVRTGSDDDFAPGETGMGLEVGDEVRSDTTGFGELGFFDGSWMRIEAQATLTLEELADTEGARAVETSIDGGRLWARAETLTGSGERFEVDTPVATASVRGTRFSIDCTVDWAEAVGSTGGSDSSDSSDEEEEEPETACAFTVIDGVVTVVLPDGTEVELRAAQRLVVPDDDREPLGPIQLVPDELYSDPWVRKNLGIDLDKAEEAGEVDELLQGEAAANRGGATLAQEWSADVEVVSSSDPRFPVGGSDSADWEVAVDCGSDGCTSSRTVVDGSGAPAVRGADGNPVVDSIAATGTGRYSIEARWTDTCERDGEVLSPTGTSVRRVGDYEVTDLEFREGRWVATELTGTVRTTTSLTAAGRAAGCALPDNAASVSFTTEVVASAR